MTGRIRFPKLPSQDPPLHVIGCDLGQVNDFTAITVVSPQFLDTLPRLDVGHIERVPLNVRYPAIVGHLCVIARRLLEPIAEPVQSAVLMTHGLRPRPVIPRVSLVLDYTGVGRGIVDMVFEAQADGRLPLECEIVPVTITSGERVNRDEGGLKVPKRDLATIVQRVLQEARLAIPDNLPFAAEMVNELTGFRVKIGLSGRETYGAGEDWRSAQHDDLVLALALAIWHCENRMEVAIH